MKCISIIQTGLLKKKQYSISLNVKNDTNKAQKLQGEFPRAKSRRYGDVDARSEHEKQSSSDEIGNKENKLTFNHLFKSKNLRRKLQ